MDHVRDRQRMVARATSVEAEEGESVPGPVELEISVDGPYGAGRTALFDKYDTLVLVAGGIGITPMHSLFRHLLLLAKEGRCVGVLAWKE
jgi:NAD(P)H-flavin reductase